MEIRYSYGAVPTVRDFARSDAFLRGLMGPFGSGKSSGAVMEFPRRAKAQVQGPDGKRHTRWAVIRGTYRQLMDTTIKTFHQWMPPHLFGTYNVSNMTYAIEAWEGCECEVLFRALDRPDHVDNLLSLELTGAWINEARETPWAIVEALQGRVGRWPAKRDGGPTWYGVWMDTNPPDSDSRWYKYFEEWLPSEEGVAAQEAFKQREGRDLAAIFKQPSGLVDAAENLANLPGGKGYYQTLMAGKDREWTKVYVEGQYGYVADGRPVFPEYNDTIHCNEKAEPIRGEPLYRGWDFGLTPACAFAQLNRFGQLVVFDELTSESMGVDQFGDAVLEHCTKVWSRQKLGWEPEWLDVGDPAGQQRAQTDERTCFQVLGAKGLMLEPGLQTLALRLESLRKPLTILRAGRPGFLLNPRCKMLRKGFMGGYQFRRMNTVREKFTDKPDKNELSHVMDGLEYIATILFGTGLTTERPRTSGKRDPTDDFPDPTRDSTTGY